MGNDLFVDAAESASFPLPSTGKREGCNKTQPLHHFPSHLGIIATLGAVGAKLYSQRQPLTFKASFALFLTNKWKVFLQPWASEGVWEVGRKEAAQLIHLKFFLGGEKK